jgi:hypothetical protein
LILLYITFHIDESTIYSCYIGGTTALWTYLQAHPQIRSGKTLPNEPEYKAKEMHFFSDEPADIKEYAPRLANQADDESLHVSYSINHCIMR